MRSTTPQEIANCYGTFIADLVIVAKKFAPVLTWLRTALPNVESTYKLNSALFSAYTASISSFPQRPSLDRFGNYSRGGVKEFNRGVSLAWTAMTIDLTSALTCAGVDPSEAVKILASFAKLKPKDIIEKDYKR